MEGAEPEPIRITADEVAAAVPPPPSIRPWAHLPPPRPDVDAPPRLSQLAVASFVTALLGIPLVGCLLGPVALLTGALALAQINNRQDRRGMGLAIAGIAIGTLEFFGWIAVLFWILGRPSGDGSLGHVPMPVWSRPSTLDADGAPPAIRGALHANVRIASRAASGSGILVGRSGEKVVVLTNHHVVSAAGNGGELTLSFASGDSAPGKVVWLAPEGVDAALVEAAPPASDRLEPTRVARGIKVAIGDPAFVIGNPLDYDATYTTGPISQLRQIQAGTHTLRVFQTQAPVNFGNSGGGLYTADGRLIGLIAWTTEKRISEGLGFAISVESVLDLLEEENNAWLPSMLKNERDR